MELKQTISVSTKKDDVYFDLFEVEAVEQGTLIRAKSHKFGLWVNSMKRAKPYTGSKEEAWTNANFCLPQWTPELDDGRILVSPTHDLFYDGQANMVWLFHGDLAEGWELLVPKPLSFNNLEDFFTTTLDNLRDLYIRYLRSGKLSAQLSEVVDE